MTNRAQIARRGSRFPEKNAVPGGNGQRLKKSRSTPRVIIPGLRLRMTYRILELPDPYRPTARRHLVCCGELVGGSIVVLRNFATFDAAMAWTRGPVGSEQLLATTLPHAADRVDSPVRHPAELAPLRPAPDKPVPASGTHRRSKGRAARRSTVREQLA